MTKTTERTLYPFICKVLEDYSWKLIQEAVKVFDVVGKLEVRPLYQRIREKDEIQRKIDEISMKMLVIDFDLDRLYEGLAKDRVISDYFR